MLRPSESAPWNGVPVPWIGEDRRAPVPKTDGDGGSPRPKKPRHPALTFLGELPGLILMAFALALIIKSLLLQAFWIPTGSMEPTLVPGDRVIVAKVPYYFHDPMRGDIIVFEEPDPAKEPERGVFGAVTHWMGQGLGFTAPDNPDYIKRVIGEPGDVVSAKRRSRLRQRRPDLRALSDATDRQVPRDEGPRREAVRDG